MMMYLFTRVDVQLSFAINASDVWHEWSLMDKGTFPSNLGRNFPGLLVLRIGRPAPRFTKKIVIRTQSPRLHDSRLHQCWIDGAPVEIKHRLRRNGLFRLWGILARIASRGSFLLETWLSWFVPRSLDPWID